MLGRLVSMTILGFVVANRPMDNWCSAARGVGVSGGYIDIVPYIGAFVSAVPSLLLAVSINLDLAVYVVLLYIVVHLIEGYIRVPLVQRRVVPLPPALILSAQIILGVVAGFSACCWQRRLSLRRSLSFGWSMSRTCSAITRQPNAPPRKIWPHMLTRAAAAHRVRLRAELRLRRAV